MTANARTNPAPVPPLSPALAPTLEPTLAGASTLTPAEEPASIQGRRRNATVTAAGWFADPAPGLDADGRSVPCRVCRTGLSQPRIDYGLDTCPSCRHQAVVTSTPAALSVSTSTRQARS